MGPQSVEHRESIYVGYRYYDKANKNVLFPFGYGLSYTEFDYSAIELSATSVAVDESLEVSVTVTNSGKRDGVEVVQLYIRDRIGSVTRPIKELKGFARVALKAGESQQVSFTLDEKTLGFYNSQGNYRVEPGAFDVFVGGGSEQLGSRSFELTNF